jgi:hypothetical protein
MPSFTVIRYFNKSTLKFSASKKWNNFLINIFFHIAFCASARLRSADRDHVYMYRRKCRHCFYAAEQMEETLYFGFYVTQTCVQTKKKLSRGFPISLSGCRYHLPFIKPPVFSNVIVTITSNSADPLQAL